MCARSADYKAASSFPTISQHIAGKGLHTVLRCAGRGFRSLTCLLRRSVQQRRGSDAEQFVLPLVSVLRAFFDQAARRESLTPETLL
jgi:hypothetical protein